MDIIKNLENEKLSIALAGRLDTTTAPELEELLNASIDGITELEFDFAELKYISSAGLRILLAAQKTMNKQGSMVLRNVNAEIMDIFDITGFADILTIENPEAAEADEPEEEEAAEAPAEEPVKEIALD